MINEITKNKGHEMAKTYEVKTAEKFIILGTLADFGLGNPDGIPSKLADATEEVLMAYGEE